MAATQRVWNRQPGGGSTGEGISPAIGVAAASAVGSGSGIESISTWV